MSSKLAHSAISDFILAVKERAELYDKNSSDEVKMERWTEVANVFNISVSEAMSQWSEMVRLHHHMYPHLAAEAFRIEPNESSDMEDVRWHAANREIALALSHFFQSELDFLLVEHDV